MRPQQLWVLKAHTEINKIDDHCQNIRQDFDIYRNIDHQKAKKLKKKQRKKNKTHKQTSGQTNKQTSKQRNKNKQAMSPVFFGPVQWLEPLRAAKRNKQKENKQASKQACKPTQTHELYM